MGRSIALVLALLTGALIAWAQLRLPEPAAANAPVVSFSAARAMADVRLIASRPHPIGSTANHAVRDALIARMSSLGLSPYVRRHDVLFSPRAGLLAGGSPETLIGVLPGRDRSLPAVALMAHYDSAPGAPGAGDDAAGVASALEVVRAVRARGQPERDVAVIFTDGEEAGLLGARGFFAKEPLARRLGFVLNLEARGSGGGVQMFETGAENGGAIALFAATAAQPSAGSLFGEVYKRLPNDTDFTLARQAGLAGLNFAFASQSFDYHSPTDTPAHLQQGSLQSMGDQALALTQALAFSSELPARSPDAVYGVLFGDLVVAYAPAWGWALLLAAAGLIALAARRARARDALPWSEVARGTGAALYLLTGAAAVLHLASVAGAADPLSAQRLLASAHRWEAAQILLAAGFLTFAAAEVSRDRRLATALLPLACAIASCAFSRGLDPVGLGTGLVAAGLAYGVGRKSIGRAGAWMGLLLLGLAGAAVVQLIAPHAAYVLAWPLLAGALAAAGSDLSADRRPAALALVTVLAAGVVGWAGVHAHLIVTVVGLPELLCLPLFMGALCIWPLVQPAAGAPPERLSGRIMLLAGAVLVAILHLTSPWSPRFPQPSLVALQFDQDAGRAWRVAHPALRTPWSDAVLRADSSRIVPFRHWAWEREMQAAPASATPIAPPEITATRNQDGALMLRIVPPPGARVLTLQLAPDAAMRLTGTSGATTSASLPGQRWTKLRWSAPPAEGLTLSFAAPNPGGLRLRWAAEFDDWKAAAAPAPPPADVMGVGRSGITVATGSWRTAW